MGDLIVAVERVDGRRCDPTSTARSNRSPKVDDRAGPTDRPISPETTVYSDFGGAQWLSHGEQIERNTRDVLNRALQGHTWM